MTLSNSPSDWSAPQPLNQKAELSRPVLTTPLHKGQGEEKLSSFQEEQGSEADPITLLTSKKKLSKKPQDLCRLFLIVSLEIVIHKLGYKRVVSVREKISCIHR